MNLSGLTHVPAFQFPFSRRLGHDPGGQERIDALTAELQAALARETALQDLNAGLAQRHDLMVLEFKMMALEFEQRFVNGLQCIAALLSLQSRIAAPEAAVQLSIAARRVAAFGRVHQRLHFVDHRRTVEFNQYLRLLCEDISGLLFRTSEVAFPSLSTERRARSRPPPPFRLASSSMSWSPMPGNTPTVTSRFESKLRWPTAIRFQ